MNRLDEIQAAARDIASNVHADPEARNKMADDLIKLIGLMIKATGKYVAGYGESSMNDAHDVGEAEDAAKFHGIYLTGEKMQSGSQWAMDESAGADLERYHRPTGHEWCVCGHHPDCHKDDACNGESVNGHACKGGECTEFRVKLTDPVWTHEDRRPPMFRGIDERGALYVPAEMAVLADRLEEGLAPSMGDHEGLIRAVVREELDRAVQQREAAHKLAVQAVWDSDQFKAQVAALSEGRPVAASSTCCHDGPLCPFEGQTPKAAGCCYPLGGFCSNHH